MKIIKKSSNSISNNNNEYPLLPLRDIVIFPKMIRTFYVGRESSVKAIENSLSFYNNKIFLVTQKNSNIEEPTIDDIYTTGTLAEIKSVENGPNKNILKVLVEGIERAKIIELREVEGVKKVDLEIIDKSEINLNKKDFILSIILKEFKKYVELAKIKIDELNNIDTVEDEDVIINFIIEYIKSPLEKRVQLLIEEDSERRLAILNNLIAENLEVIALEKKIVSEVKKKLEKGQVNESVFSQQLKHDPMKDFQDEAYSEEAIKKRLEELNAPEYIFEKILKEVKRLNKMPALSPEAGIIRTYIDSLLELPWGKSNEENSDLHKAKKILDSEHYSLRKVKNRILEYLAVRTLNKKTKGPILCFVGPPGTGKTSLGRSVANATGREFVRVSLGGVRDEAEIRGHRRTYLGAMPGKIIQSMKKLKSNNPVFLLDEIDKMSSDFRGDPASALLEVLDPEQNSQFVDHYLEVPYDLSNVMFITTANSKQAIPYPLLDRMEIITIPSYTEFEKLNIAKKFLLPKEKEINGLSDIDIRISNKTILSIIRNYTMEAGVRSLQRQLATICRKIAKKMVLGKVEIKSVRISEKNITSFLGKKKFIQPEIEKSLDIGVAHGLAWSEVGGSILPIEVVLYQGSGKINLTGKIGEVMKESAQTAISFLRANMDKFDIKYNDFYKDYDVHIHFPEGAIPKDGPSAGIAITCAILSALTKERVPSNIAMTGEITLTGKVLPIGGLLEKSIAAIKNSKESVIIPYDNEKEVEELPKGVKDKIKFIPVKRAMQVIKLVFGENVFNESYKNKKEVKTDYDNLNDQLYDNPSGSQLPC